MQVLPAQSVDPVSLVIAKVIKAIDLKIQKLQNETIRLQQVQQVAEEALSKSKLSEIKDWQKKQQELYADYFNELQGVNAHVKQLPQVKQILAMQAQVVTAYQKFTKNASSQRQFNALLQSSGNIIGSLQVLLSPGQLTLKDVDRITAITDVRDAMADCLDQINQLNQQLEIHAAHDLRKQRELNLLRKLNQQP